MKRPQEHKSKFVLIAFVCIGIISTALRFYLNFSSTIIPGINGAYYLLQVRNILNDGSLAFSDMPFLFYLDATIIRLISFFTGSISDDLIIGVVKFVDSIDLPLLLIPLYKLLKNNCKQSSDTLKISLALYAVLSFSPMNLVSEIQKNAMAIVFAFAAITSLMQFFKNISLKNSFWPFLWIGLTAMTHFGTFNFLLSFILIILFVLYKRKAVVPSLIIVLVGLSVIAIFDLSRFYRLLDFFDSAFRMPLLLYGIIDFPDLFLIIFSYALVVLGFLYVKKNSKSILPLSKAILITSSIVLFCSVMPFLDIEYFRRFSMFTFIPQIIIICHISEKFNSIQRIFTLILIFTITLYSVFPLSKNLKTPVINAEEYSDLKKIDTILDKKSTSIILARHGLEWWAAWVLEIDVEHEKAVDEKLPKNYSCIYFLEQNRLHYPDEAAKNWHFHEQIIPDNTTIVYKSDYFTLYKLKR